MYGPGIRKLKRLCARATIKVPPSTYRSTRSESDIEGALLELLHKHKLGVDAKDSQLLRVKAKLEQARELEGKGPVSLSLSFSLLFEGLMPGLYQLRLSWVWPC